MRLEKYTAHLLYGALALVLLIIPTGCGGDPGMYRGETLTFETPVSSKVTSTKTSGKKNADLDLGADQSADFRFRRIGAWVPWAQSYPLFDYYLEPVPVEVPVSPWFSVIEYIHPFYAYPFFNSFWDDDNGHRFREDD